MGEIQKPVGGGGSKKVKNGGAGDGPESDDISELGNEASIEIMSRKFKILREK